MWNEPSKDELATLPSLDSTNDYHPLDKLVWMHFFLGSYDFYVVEYSAEDRIFYGFTCLGDEQNAEWGYTSFDEIQSIDVNGFQIDRDLDWQPKKAGDIELIQRWAKRFDIKPKKATL